MNRRCPLHAEAAITVINLPSAIGIRPVPTQYETDDLLSF